jgi:hypothetical protein
MARVELHPAVAGLRGKMGNVVYRYNKKTGKTSTSKIPDMTEGCCLCMGAGYERLFPGERPGLKKVPVVPCHNT